jgi:ParB family chromosome partitioning protein
MADKVGKSRTAVANVLRLLSLPSDIKKLIREGKLTEGHARALLALGSETEMRMMAEKIVSESMSVRDVERQGVKKRRKRLVPKRKLPELMEVETYLKRLLGTSVKITPGLKRGRIEVEYYGDDDLERLLELFRIIDAK